MRAVVFLFTFILFSFSFSKAEYFVITKEKTGYKNERFILYLYLQDVFDDYDKALYFAEDIKMRRDIPYYIVNTDKETLSKNIKTSYVLACINSAKTLSYKSDFNKELFFKDLEELSKMMSLDYIVIETCSKKNNKKRVCKKDIRYKKEKLDSFVPAECKLNSLEELRDILKNYADIEKAKEIVLELDKYLGGR